MFNDILRKTPMYKSIASRAREEGFAEGFAKGREEEQQLHIATLCEKALMVQHTHKQFYRLSQLVCACISEITKPDVLLDLIITLALAQDADEAEKALLPFAPNNQANSAS